MFPLIAIQKLARQRVNHHFLAPQRYGTAFHITPPVTDVRTLPLITPHPSPSTINDWQTLKTPDQNRIIHFCHTTTDPYLLWHLSHPAHGTTDIIHVPPKKSRQLQWKQTHASSVMWIILEPQSKLHFEDIITPQPFALRRLIVWQKPGSSFTSTHLRTHLDFLNEEVTIHLIGEGASVNVRHLTLNQSQRQQDIYTHIHHHAPHTTSNLHVRSSGLSQSKTIYRGLIEVTPQAYGSEGRQHGHALLLSPRTVIDVLPELKIETSDVHASHGVTTSHLDPLKLFYLRSRGLSYTQARQLAVTGFYHHQLEIPTYLSSPLQTAINNISL